MTNEQTTPKRFPLLLDLEFRQEHEHWLQWIPWAIAKQAYKEYVRRGHGDQSLERVAERGGFSPEEIDALLASDYTPFGVGRRFDEPWGRAGSLCVCPVCGCEYWEHPPSPWYIDTCTNTPWLHRLCDGRLVKL